MEKRVIAIFPQGGNFSGQTSAAWHVMQALTHHGWCVESLTTPVFSRTGNRWRSLADYGREIRRLCRSVVSTLHVRPLFYLYMGQSWVALLRDDLTYLLASGCGWRGPGILSLHGNWFMTWSRFELKALWLVLIGAL